MKFWSVRLTIAIIFIFLFALTFYNEKDDRNDTCKTREVIESTALSFRQTMRTLEEAVIEGSEKIQAIREPEARQSALDKIDKQRYYTDEEGIFQSVYIEDGSTGFATGFKPLDQNLKNNLMATETLNEYFEELLNRFPFVTQVYYNDVESFTRIYPAFSTEGMIGANMDMTAYNFLNEAVRDRDDVKFINTPYIDPAGKGWVVSMVKAVEYEGELIGAFGVDLSVDMLQRLLIVKNGMLIVNEYGDVIALSEDMYQQAGLKVLKEHRYYSGVDRTILLPEDYNLNKSKILGLRQMWQGIIMENKVRGEIEFDSKECEYCSIEIEGYGIYLIHINTD